MDANELMQALAALIATQGDTPAARKRAGSQSRKVAGPKATAARTPAATNAAVWTCKKAWKGQEPTGGILWAARQAGVSGDLLASADKLALSQAIGKARGLRVVVE